MFGYFNQKRNHDLIMTYFCFAWIQIHAFIKQIIVIP